MLLALAEADACFEQIDREQRRPSFPRIEGRPASAVERYLDSQASSKVSILSFEQHACFGVAMTCKDVGPAQGCTAAVKCLGTIPRKDLDPDVCQRYCVEATPSCS